MSQCPFQEGETVYVHRHRKLKKGFVKYQWGNGDLHIKLEGKRDPVSYPPEKVYHQWDVGYAEIPSNADKEGSP